MKYALYRHFDKDEKLLYVGMSGFVFDRNNQHRYSSWYDEIKTITIEKFDSKEDALRAETDAISRENPVYNIMGKGRNSKIVLRGEN
jgi:excinuclease UvrABC nuclease subunit